MLVFVPTSKSGRKANQRRPLRKPWRAAARRNVSKPYGSDGGVPTSAYAGASTVIGTTRYFAIVAAGCVTDTEKKAMPAILPALLGVAQRLENLLDRMANSVGTPVRDTVPIGVST